MAQAGQGTFDRCENEDRWMLVMQALERLMDGAGKWRWIEAITSFLANIEIFKCIVAWRRRDWIVYSVYSVLFRSSVKWSNSYFRFWCENFVAFNLRLSLKLWQLKRPLPLSFDCNKTNDTFVCLQCQRRGSWATARCLSTWGACSTWPARSTTASRSPPSSSGSTETRYCTTDSQFE